MSMAALAERNRSTVLRRDEDFDRIAEVRPEGGLDAMCRPAGGPV
jgi:hypothetical protein